MDEPLKLSISVRSASLTIAEISELIGCEPTRCHEKGAVVSSRNPDGRKHESNYWRLEAETETERDLWALAEELKPTLTRLTDLRGRFESVEVWLMAYARPMGAWVTFDSEAIDLMGGAGAELHLDMYCGTECCEDDDED